MSERTIGLRRLSVSRDYIIASEFQPQPANNPEQTREGVVKLLRHAMGKVKGHGLTFVSASDAPATQMEIRPYSVLDAESVL